MTLMNEMGIDKLSYKSEGKEILLERKDRGCPPVAAPVVTYSEPVTSAPPAPAAPSGNFIESPLVGTFYASPSPNDPPFVKEGDVVTEETVVGIIEAMKVMNEVKAGIKGKIAKICIENAHPVEYGTKLFQVH